MAAQYWRFHLYESWSRVLARTVAEGSAEAPKTAEDVQVQLSAQLRQLYPYHAVPPHHTLFTLQTRRKHFKILTLAVTDKTQSKAQFV